MAVIIACAVGARNARIDEKCNDCISRLRLIRSPLIAFALKPYYFLDTLSYLDYNN